MIDKKLDELGNTAESAEKAVNKWYGFIARTWWKLAVLLAVVVMGWICKGVYEDIEENGWEEEPVQVEEVQKEIPVTDTLEDVYNPNEQAKE